MSVSNLFLIACSGYKAENGRGPVWQIARTRAEWNSFSFLDGSRIKLINFLSDLSNERAKNENRSLRTYPTMAAIERYQGKVYEMAGDSIRKNFDSSSINSVLIVSSLFGILHPNDMIPDYELMMKDESPSGDRMHEWWREEFKRHHIDEVIGGLYPGLNNIYCFMSKFTGYVDAVEDLGDHYNMFVVHVQNGNMYHSPGTWGKTLKSCLEVGASNPEAVARIIKPFGCELQNL